MVKILVRIGLFAGCFLLLLPVSRSAGGTAKNPIQGMFTERVLPDGQILTCWRDICPGQTTVDEAIRILQADPTFYPPDDLDLANLRESPLCWQSRASSYTVCLDARDNLLVDLHLYLDLEDNANSSAHLRLHLGDLITLWGPPITISPPFCAGSTLYFSKNRAAYVSWNMLSQDNRGLDPELSEIQWFQLNAPKLAYADATAGPWRGFVSSSFIPCGGE